MKLTHTSNVCIEKVEMPLKSASQKKILLMAIRGAAPSKSVKEKVAHIFKRRYVAII